MRAYEKLTRRSLTGFLFMMVACSGDNGGGTGVNNGDDGGSQDGDTRRHMLLQVTSGNPPRGGVFDVAIYDQVTGVRQVLGSSLPSGKFCTRNTLDASRRYIVEFYELPSRRCIIGVENVSLSSNPIWWAESCSGNASATVHMGVPPFSSATGCLGP